MKYFFVMGVAVSIFLMPNLSHGVDASVEAIYAGRYIWRGMPLNEEPVIQPSIDFSGAGFSLNFWGNIDMTDWGEEEGGYEEDESGNFTEIDYTASYEHAIGPVSLGVGFITYTFPNLELDPVLEVFAGLAVDVLLSPSVTSYWDESVAWGANYLSLDIGHSFDLWESGDMSLGLDLFAHAATVSEEFTEAYYGIEEAGWHDWSAGASIPLSLKYGFCITPGYSHSSLMNEDIRDVVEDIWDRDPDSDVLTVSLSWSRGLSND